ncbi:MAG: hypothetical protein WCQ50_13700 [Spirochaetota bacterium]
MFTDAMGCEAQATFTELCWSGLVGKIAGTYRLDQEERQQLQSNKVARLVGGLPFVSGCAEPLRTSLSHLSLFFLASTEACRYDFDHRPTDDGDPLIRLERISHFIGGNRSVLDEGMARLGLAMLGGYQRDLGKDKASGEYNPLNAGIWDYDTIEAMLKSRIGISALPKEAEAFFDSVGTLMWWGG